MSQDMSKVGKTFDDIMHPAYAQFHLGQEGPELVELRSRFDALQGIDDPAEALRKAREALTKAQAVLGSGPGQAVYETRAAVHHALSLITPKESNPNG